MVDQTILLLNLSFFLSVILLIFYLWPRPTAVLTQADEISAANTIAGVLRGDFDLDSNLEGEKGKCRVRPGRGESYVAQCVQMAQVEFGVLSDCPSNRMMVHKFLRDQMREHGVRVSHIAQYLPIAVDLSIVVPSNGSVTASKVKASYAMYEWLGVASAKWVSKLVPSQVWKPPSGS